MIDNRILRYGLLCAAVALSGCGSSADKEKKYLEKAHTSFKAQNYDKTRIELKNVLQINPKNTDALYLMAQLAEKENDWRKMFGLLSGIVIEKPEFIDAQLLLGKLFLVSGDQDKAMEKAALGLAKNPDDRDALILKALVLLKKNDKPAAQAIATKVLTLKPGDVEATYLLVKLLTESKQSDEILRLIDVALTAHPEELNLALMKMQALVTANKRNIADNMVGDLLKRFPEKNSLYYGMAKYYIGTQQIDLAEQVLQNLITHKPSETEPKLKLVEFFLNQKNETKAEQTLLDYIKANPNNYEFHFALASFYLYKDKIEHVTPLLNQIVEQDREGASSLKAKNILAKLMLKKGDKAKAEQIIEEVIKIDAHNEDALMLRSTFFLDKGKYEAAIGDLRTVLRDHPQSENANILAAKTHLKSGYIDLAQESFKNSLVINPANVEVRKNLARILAMKKDETGAIALLEELGPSKQQNDEVLVILVDLYARKGEWAKAEATAKAITETNSAGLSPFKLAQLYVAQKKFPAAIDSFHEALKLKPLELDILSGLTNTYLAMGEPGKAIALLDKTLTVQPDNINLLNLKGLVYLNQKNFANAEQIFSTVISLFKTNEIGYRNLAAAHIVQNQLDQALKVYQQGLIALPQNINLMQNITKLYQQMGKPDAAIAMYTELLKINPENKLNLNNFAALTAETTTDPKRLSEAFELVKAFKDSKEPTFLDTFGWLSLLNGQVDDALSSLEKVVKLQPEFPEFNYHLGMAYAAKGRNEEAKQALQKALSKNVQASWVNKAKLKLEALK
ncbi:MAG: tetratricopeptide repeat protein [Methylococcaceae bacterium]|nr:tetratricopeptide repeat protein [Methylococcaceae bacterium]